MQLQLEETLALAKSTGIDVDFSVPYELSQPKAFYDDEMRYVKLRANLLHLESSLAAGGAYVAAFDGTAAGRSLLLRHQQPSTLADIQASIRKLEGKLGLDNMPSLESPRMQASFISLSLGPEVIGSDASEGNGASEKILILE